MLLFHLVAGQPRRSRLISESGGIVEIKPAALVSAQPLSGSLAETSIPLGIVLYPKKLGTYLY